MLYLLYLINIIIIFIFINRKFIIKNFINIFLKLINKEILLLL